MQSTGHAIVGGLCARLSNNVQRVTFICADKSASALKAFDFDLMRWDHALHCGASTCRAMRRYGNRPSEYFLSGISAHY